MSKPNSVGVTRIKKAPDYEVDLYHILQEVRNVERDKVVAAMVNGLLVDLRFTIKYPCVIRWIDIQSRVGMDVYRRSGLHILHTAVQKLFGPERLKFGQSFGPNYYFEFSNGQPFTQQMVARLKKKMMEVIKASLPFEIRSRSVISAQRMLRKMGFDRRANLLNYALVPEIKLVGNDDHLDIYRGPYIYDTSKFSTFDLRLYSDGVLVQFPNLPDLSMDFQPMPEKAFALFKATRERLVKFGLTSISELNEKILENRIGEMIKIWEGHHEKQIARIADDIAERRKCRVVMISGPSSSGKTTFLKRLSIQLRVNGINPVPISLDDFFIDREKTPKDEEGHYDFERLDALNVPLINRTIRQLMEGERVEMPQFNFKLGKANAETGHFLQLGDQDVMIVEGLHGLNPEIGKSVPATCKFKIFVCPLTHLSIDHQNTIYQADTRLLRRMVRDRLFRGYRADQTLESWKRVRRGEEKYIWPFQEEADVIFDTSIIYEHAALKYFAERFLKEVPLDSEYHSEATRLIEFLSLFVPVFPEEIPGNSILREFIGGSTFQY